MLAWMFYEKDSASKKVLRAESAFTWRQKLVTMGNEVYRRLRNSTRQLSLRAKAGLLCTFTDKLRKSGYGQRSVDGIMISGVTQYYRKLEIDLQGGPPLNSGGGEDEVTRRRAKASASQDWFSRRRGGQEERERKIMVGGGTWTRRPAAGTQLELGELDTEINKATQTEHPGLQGHPVLPGKPVRRRSQTVRTPTR